MSCPWKIPLCDSSLGSVVTSDYVTLLTGTLWTIKQWKTTRKLHGVRAIRGILRHLVSGISDVDPRGTIRGHPACIAMTGATRDEGQEEQCCESSGGSVGARHSLTERQPGKLRGRDRTFATIHRMLFRKEATL